MPVLKSLSSFEYSFHPNFGNWMQFHKEGFKQTTAYTYITALEQKDSAALLKEMYPRLRNKIMNAQQMGWVVQPLTVRDVVMDLLEQTYTAKGNKYPISIARLKDFMHVLEAQNALQLTGVFKDNELAAVLGLVYDNNTAYLIFNGVSNSFSDKGVNEFLLFEGMQWAAKKGLKHFDFEGSMVPNIESFYRQFGGVLTPYHKIWMESKQRSLRNLKQKLL
jgi:lipid II:glycine glycyltransferase (peptidoglycan interpeptide bridge formation enzyme)